VFGSLAMVLGCGYVWKIRSEIDLVFDSFGLHGFSLGYLSLQFTDVLMNLHVSMVGSTIYAVVWIDHPFSCSEMTWLWIAFIH
jgi:hypothetical protein